MYRPVGLNVGGLVGKIGKSLSGSPIIHRMIRNLSGNVPMCGLTLSATGLYFFLVERLIVTIFVSSDLGFGVLSFSSTSSE